MNINFQSDDLNWNNSVSSYSSAFSSDNDDIPNLNDQNPSNYSPKNIEKVLSNQFHDLIIGEISSAHLNTLQTNFEGFPKNTELEGGLKHKSRSEIAIESTKNITPQLEQFIYEYLNESLENAVCLSAKNYGADFVQNKNSDEEEDNKSNKEEEDNEEEEKVNIIDQEITLNDKSEEKKPFINSLKSLFNKSKENETNEYENSNASFNDSTSWWSKANLKKSKSVGPKSLQLNSLFEAKNNGESITENEEKSKKKSFFNSFPFFKSNNNNNLENSINNDDEKENSNQKQISKTQSSPKIIFKNIFSSPKENSTNNENNKNQKTVRFVNVENDETKSNNSNNSSIDNNSNNNNSSNQNENKNSIEPENKQVVVMVENLEDFSSATISESDSQRCHTPNSNPDIEADLFEVKEEEQETDEEIVKNLIRPPTPEKEVKILYSESEASDKNSIKQNENQLKEISFDSDSNSEMKNENDTKNNNSYQSNESKSAKDQDLLLSASESESEKQTANNNINNDNNSNNKVRNYVDKKNKSNLFNLHLSSSTSDHENDDDNDKQKNNNVKQNDKVTKDKKVDNIDISNYSSQNEEATKQTMSNVEFIANELSDFQLDHEKIMNESNSQNNSLTNTNGKTNEAEQKFRYTNPILNKKQPLKISNQSSQTHQNRGIRSRRKQNIIQENTYFEVFEDSPNSTKKRIRRRKVASNEEEEVDESNQKSIKTRRRLMNSNSNSSSPDSPKGRSSNSSSPHSSRHPYSPVHTHTHTPVPVKPRLILKNNSSSDEYSDNEILHKRRITKKSETTSIRNHHYSSSPKSKGSPNSTATFSSPPHNQNSPQPAIRKRKSHLMNKSIETDDSKIVDEIPIKRTQRRRRNEVDENENLSAQMTPNDQGKRIIKRKKRASSEKRIKTRNPQFSLLNQEKSEEEEESKRTIKKKIVKKRRNPSQQPRLSSTLPRQEKIFNRSSDSDYDNNDTEIKSPKIRNSRVQSTRLVRSTSDIKSQSPKRRQSVDNSIIDKKALAKNGVRSIILIEFDKKTPLIENFLEQISSNPGSLSQSSPHSRRTHSIISTRVVDDDDFPSLDEKMKSSKSAVRPKITKHVKNRINKSKVLEDDDSNSYDQKVENLSTKSERPKVTRHVKNRIKKSKDVEDDDSISYDSNGENLNTKSETKVRSRKRRQNSVKPSSLNKTVHSQKQNLEVNRKVQTLSKTVKEPEIKSKTESENVIRPVRKINRTGKRRRNESVKSDLVLKRTVEQSEDYQNIKFNFKKLFDEAERNERLEKRKK